jgi:ubiquinone/menaquinone biosynthesis C-methylase UbiE
MSLAQRAMEHRLLAPVYQRVWRPAWFLSAMAFDIPHFLHERHKAVTALRLEPGDRVLDIACGPGNFTSDYASAVGRSGMAIGIDLSRPMLAHALVDNAATGAQYVQGSAHRLPFADGSFDAVACYGALYLIPDPFRAVAEMIRVVRPGGRVAVMTSVAPDAVRGLAQRAVGPAGLRVFGAHEVTERLEAARFGEVSRETHGFLQYVAGTAPSG